MKSHVTRSFSKLFQKLPDHVKRKAIQAFKLWKSDRSQTGLHFKKVHVAKPIYSARVGRDYRVLGLVDEEQIYWFWIGSHSAYDKLLNQL